MTAALYYHPEAYTTSGPKLMGRNAAGESFLRGFLIHSRVVPYTLANGTDVAWINGSLDSTAALLPGTRRFFMR